MNLGFCKYWFLENSSLFIWLLTFCSKYERSCLSSTVNCYLIFSLNLGWCWNRISRLLLNYLWFWYLLLLRCSNLSFSSLLFSSHLANRKYDMKSWIQRAFIVETSFDYHSRSSWFLNIRDHLISINKTIKHIACCWNVTRRANERNVISNWSLIFSS